MEESREGWEEEAYKSDSRMKESVSNTWEESKEINDHQMEWKALK